MNLVQKKFSYSEYYEEQREFGRRQKQKAKMTRDAHNAEMAQNKARKLKLEAIALENKGDMEAAKLKAAESGRQLNRATGNIEKTISRAENLAATKRERLLKKYAPEMAGTETRRIGFGPRASLTSNKPTQSGVVNVNTRTHDKYFKYKSPSNKKFNNLRYTRLSEDSIAEAAKDNRFYNGMMANDSISSPEHAKELQRMVDSGMTKKEIQNATRELNNKKLQNSIVDNSPKSIVENVKQSSANVASKPSIDNSIKNATKRVSEEVKIKKQLPSLGNYTKGSTEKVTENIAKKGLSRNKKLVLGATGIAGLAYGGKRLYDHYNKKDK